MVSDDMLARVGMGAVAVVGVVLALVGTALFADGVARGADAVPLVAYALCGLGGGMSVALGVHHYRDPGDSTAALTGVPASMGGVAAVFATTDPTAPLFPVVLAVVGLALVGSGLATYAEAAER